MVHFRFARPEVSYIYYILINERRFKTLTQVLYLCVYATLWYVYRDEKKQTARAKCAVCENIINESI